VGRVEVRLKGGHVKVITVRERDSPQVRLTWGTVEDEVLVPS
jgi:hypothetical protein